MAGEASANRTQLAIIKESSYGVKKTGSNLQVIRPTGETLKQDTTIEVSKEIRSDLQTANIVRTAFSASGNVNAELTHDTYDDWLASAIKSSGWSVPVVIGPVNTISFVAVDNSINDSGGGLAGVTVGQWLLIAGAGSTNGGYAKIVSKTANKIVVSHKTLSDGDAGAQITLTQGKYIVNGTTLDTYNVERLYEDLSNVLALFTGMGINTMALTTPSDAMSTLSFGLIGRKEESLAASGGTGYTAATTTKPMTVINDMTAFLENGVPAGFLTASFNINNNLRIRQEGGIADSAGPTGLGMGKFTIDGTMDVFFRTSVLFDKYLNQTESSIAVQFRNSTGEGYIFELPRIRITDGQREAGGENTDIIAKIKFGAFMHETEGKTVRIASFG